jgi:hypothetical protein
MGLCGRRRRPCNAERALSRPAASSGHLGCKRAFHFRRLTAICQGALIDDLPSRNGPISLKRGNQRLSRQIERHQARRPDLSIALLGGDCWIICRNSGIRSISDPRSSKTRGRHPPRSNKTAARYSCWKQPKTSLRRIAIKPITFHSRVRGLQQSVTLARGVARSFAGTGGFEQSRRERKKIEMRLAHLKRILRLGWLRLRGPAAPSLSHPYPGAILSCRAVRRAA